MALGLCAPGIGSAHAATLAQHDGLVWVNVECGGTTLNFVVDTGAACSCIDLGAARRAGLRFGEAVNVAGVGGGTIGYECRGFQATVGGMELPRKVMALDLSGPSRGCSRPIDGLIGADFFKGKVVRIDYARGDLACGAGPVRGGVPLRFAAGVMCVRVAVDGGRPRWTRVDTGCTNALDWCDGADCRAGVADRTVALAWSKGAALPADVTVGNIELHSVPLKLHEREIFPGEAGLLGNAVLSKYRVTIDGIQKRLVLE